MLVAPSGRHRVIADNHIFLSRSPMGYDHSPLRYDRSPMGYGFSPIRYNFGPSKPHFCSSFSRFPPLDPQEEGIFRNFHYADERAKRGKKRRK
jgi:hypothetical protein